MKRHSTDFVSLVSGLVLLSIVIVWALASSLDDLPGGWVVAAVLLLVGAAGVAGTLRRREPAEVTAGNEPLSDLHDPFIDSLSVAAPAGYTFPTGSPSGYSAGSPVGTPAGSPVGTPAGSPVGTAVAEPGQDDRTDDGVADDGVAGYPTADLSDTVPADGPQDAVSEDPSTAVDLGNDRDDERVDGRDDGRGGGKAL